jgi:hypothetical protein
VYCHGVDAWFGIGATRPSFGAAARKVRCSQRASSTHAPWVRAR